MKRDPITRMTIVALVSATLLVLSGCKRDTPAADVPAGKAATDASRDSAPSAVEDSVGGFDINSVPVSDMPLGAFPYLSLPEGYRIGVDPMTRDFDRFPFWVEDHFEWVEGTTYTAGIRPVEGRRFSHHELRQNIEHLVKAAGGIKVSDVARIPYEATESFDQDIRIGHANGLGSIHSQRVTTYVIRRHDQHVWVHFCSEDAMAGIVIAATKPFVATATLLPAEVLKQQLDSTGKATVHVNFSSNASVILPDSAPQIAQVVGMLSADPTLQISVNGHTDDSGDAARNQVLSEQRAQAVVTALSGQGIDPGRLQSKGFGASDPVADNGNEAGKAENRRVELVKR